MLFQVEGAVMRAYNRWIEDLTSLPEYKASLQMEREKWEEEQEKFTKLQVCITGFIFVSLSSTDFPLLIMYILFKICQVSRALREAEEQWHKEQKNQPEGRTSENHRVEELQEEVAALQTQLEQVRTEQAALLKAELAGARAAWNRDKQKEISLIQVRSEQVFQTKLQEQCKKLEQGLQQARQDADFQKKELLSQMEAKLQQSLGAREEEWRSQHEEKVEAQRQQMRDELLAELQTGFAELKAHFPMDPKADQQGTEDMRMTSGVRSEGTIMHIIQASCQDIVKRAISQAKEDWRRVSCY